MFNIFSFNRISLLPVCISFILTISPEGNSQQKATNLDQDLEEKEAHIEMKDKLIKNATILTMNQQNEIIEGGYIVIKDNRIAEIGQGEPPQFSGFIIDAKGQLLMPGFVNTHSHIPMTIFRGLADDLPLEQWLNNYIWPVENKFLTEETVALGTRLGLVEMIRSGTTTFNDMYFYTESIAQEVEKAGIRVVIGEGLLEFPTASYHTIEEAFAITEQFIKKWKGHAIIQPSVAPHAIYTSST